MYSAIKYAPFWPDLFYRLSTIAKSTPSSTAPNLVVLFGNGRDFCAFHFLPKRLTRILSLALRLFSHNPLMK